MTTNTQKCLLLLFTLALAVTQTNAKYLDGILRLYRGDEGFVDSTAKSTDLTLHPVVAGTDHGITFQYDKPYAGKTRKVFDFTLKGRARGSAVGLPEGSAPRTIIGFFKTSNSEDSWNGPFGYGKEDCNNAYYFWINGNTVELNQWCYDEGVNPVIDSFVENKWYHVAATWDGTNHRVYVDGTLAKTGQPQILPGTVVNSVLGASVALGGNPHSQDGDLGVFLGRVADFAIFDRVLSDTEVKEIYDDPNGLEGVPNKAKEGEWFIYNAGDATEKAISPKEIEILLPFNTSNRDRGANVYESDCVTALNSSDLVTNLHTTTPTSDIDDGFIQFNTTFKVDIDAFNETDYLTPFTDGEQKGGRILICVETFLEIVDTYDLGNDANQKVNFKNNVLNISISLTSDFTVDSVDVKREEVDTENVETDYSEFVEAFLCDSSQNEIAKSDITYKQGKRITLCVSDTPKDDNTRIVQVEEFDSLVVSQDGLSPYNFIKNSLFNPEITTPACVDGTGDKRRVCYVEFVALPRFFAEADPKDLIISGSVFVVRDGSRVRRSLHMALPAPKENNAENALAISGRRAQAEGEEGSGDFEVFASLESTADSAAPGLTTAAAGLVSMLVGAAGETLMA